MDVQVDHGDRKGVGDGGREGFPSVESGRRPPARAGPEGPRLARTRWVTFDQITGPSWVRPAGFDALHHADRGPDRACEVTQQVAGGPASARRGALPVGLDDLDQDGVKKSSPWLNSSAVRLLIPGLPSTPADELEWSDSLRLPRCRRVD